MMAQVCNSGNTKASVLQGSVAFIGGLVGNPEETPTKKDPQMSDFLSAFCRLRPFAFHLTALSNVDTIRSTGYLYSAQHILTASGQEQWLGIKRSAPLGVKLEGSQVLLRDQKPLHERNIAFCRGMNFEAFIRSLNAKVFFWPGDADGPIRCGRSHYERYREECPTILRIPTLELLLANPTADPLFCCCNSGSPRCYEGLPRPRGRETFLSAEDFGDRPSRVMELVFENKAALPNSTAFSTSGFSAFKPLF